MQAESTTTREYGGSGLGLTIVHSLVEMLSGQLHVSSEYGIGTRFEIQLPIELVENRMRRSSCYQLLILNRYLIKLCVYCWWRITTPMPLLLKHSVVSMA